MKLRNTYFQVYYTQFEIYHFWAHPGTVLFHNVAVFGKTYKQQLNNSRQKSLQARKLAEFKLLQFQFIIMEFVIRFYKNKGRNNGKAYSLPNKSNFPVSSLGWNKYGDSFSNDFVAVSGVVADYNNSKTAVFHVALQCDERKKGYFI